MQGDNFEQRLKNKTEEGRSPDTKRTFDDKIRRKVSRDNFEQRLKKKMEEGRSPDTRNTFDDNRRGEVSADNSEQRLKGTMEEGVCSDTKDATRQFHQGGINADKEVVDYQEVKVLGGIIHPQPKERVGFADSLNANTEDDATARGNQPDSNDAEPVLLTFGETPPNYQMQVLDDYDVDHLEDTQHNNFDLQLGVPIGNDPS